jgi:hypothetical protein
LHRSISSKNRKYELIKSVYQLEAFPRGLIKYAPLIQSVLTICRKSSILVPVLLFLYKAENSRQVEKRKPANSRKTGDGKFSVMGPFNRLAAQKDSGLSGTASGSKSNCLKRKSGLIIISYYCLRFLTPQNFSGAINDVFYGVDRHLPFR